MKNLVPLDYLIKKIKSNPFLKDIVEVGYSNYPHKYYVIFKDGKKIRFGHRDYKDTLYRKYNNEDEKEIKERQRLYRIRHADEKNNNIQTAGYLSYYILW